VDHIAGETFHGRRGAVENAFKYGIDYVMVDAEALRLSVRPVFRAQSRGVPFALGSRPWWRAQGGSWACLGAGGSGDPWPE
jgi:hypothetical protein